MVKPPALLIGTRDNAPYHPLGPVEGLLGEILSDAFELTTVAEPGQLSLLDSGRFRLLVCYADTWEGTLDDGPMASLLRFVDEGGGLLVLHNGICYQNRPEFVSLVGARFTGHPPAGPLEFRGSAADHPILREAPVAWTMGEEPYRFEFEPLRAVTVLCEYQHAGDWYPAAWSASSGRGRLVYLMPGHSREAFLHLGYRSLVLASARWLLNPG